MRSSTPGAKFYLLAALLISVAIPPMRAQTSRGSVSGLVIDAQKGAIPGAVVDLTAVATNVTRSTTSNEAGLYRFDAVDPGNYTISVKSSGFRTFSTRDIEVNAAQAVTLDAALEIGELAQVVEVSAGSVQLQAEAPVRGKTVQTTDIFNLPYSSRNPAMLSLTAPGVTTNRFSTPTNTFSVNGGRGRSNNFMVDGTDNNDISVAGQAFTLRNPSAIQEVSVQTSNYDAEFGRAGGAVVNLITRSGTNDFHGAAGFVLDSTRDDAISSSLSRDPGIQARGKNFAGTEQQFDGSIGGRLIRDRTFFFGHYLELRQFSQSSTEMKTLTAAGRSTLRNLFPAGRNKNADLLLGITQGFDGNFLLEDIELGDGRPSIQFGRLLIPYSQKVTQRQWGIKIDHRLGEKDSLSGRLLTDDQNLPAGGETLSFPSFNTSNKAKTYSAALYHTHIFSPSMTNELRPAYTRVDTGYPLDSENPLGQTLPQIAIAGINTTSQGIFGIRSNFPQGRVFNNYVLQDTLSIIRGSHSIRVGFDLMNQRARQLAPFNERGLLNYSVSAPQGGQRYTGLANFIDDFGGNGSAGRAFGNASYYPSLFRQSYFVQDRWRASSALTISVGVRYEYFGTPMNVVPTPAYIGIFNVDPVTFESPFTLPNKVNADKNNFAPALGIAYSPAFTDGLLGRLLGDRRSSFRAGYNIGYDSFFNNITSNVVAAAPNNVADTLASVISATEPRGVSGLSGRLPTVAPAIRPTLRQSGIDQNLRNPYYQRWSASLQRELPAGFLLEMAYVGSKGTRLFAQEDLNPLVPANLRGPAPSVLPPGYRLENRLDPLSGERSVRTNGGSSSYNSGQFELKRRFRGGLGFTTAYTWSKAIDNASEIFAYGNTANLSVQGVPSIFGGLSLDRAVSFFDRPHRWVATYNYELPFLRSQRGAAGRLLGGWSVSGITAYESGNPYTVVNGQDADGLGGGTGDRPDFNPLGRRGVRAVPDSARCPSTGYCNPDAGNLPIEPREARYIGLSSNTSPNRTRSGTLGRNTERGPGLKNWDINIIKNIRVSERVRLEFRTELFNVFNTPQYGATSVSPFAPAQNSQTIAASVFVSQPGTFLDETLPDGGGRVIRWQLRLHF